MFWPSAARTRYYSYVVPDSTACVAVISRTSSTIPALPTLSRAYFTVSLKVSVAVTVALVIVDVKLIGRDVYLNVREQIHGTYTVFY